MPNTGRPSQDCHLCRQRRVKCDLRRPGCQRCDKYGVECPGYRDQHELVFRNVNPSTVKKRTAKRAAAKQDQDDSKSPLSASTRSSTPASAMFILDPRAKLLPLPGDTVSTAPTIISRPLTEHWTNHSVPIILNVYSTLDFLHNIYQINPQNGPLVWAAHLFSRTYVTNIRYPVSIYRESEVENQRELGTYLGKTLSAVNTALKEPDGAFRDDVLATVWILANYELLVGSLGRMGFSSPWHVHARGLYSILKTRGTQHLLTAEGRTAFWPCYNMVQIQALISNTECPPESDEWLGIIRNNLYDDEGFTLRVSIFITKCTHVQATIVNLLHRRDFAAAEEQYESLVAQITEAQRHVNNYAKTTVECSHDMDDYMRNLYYSAIIKGYSYVLMLTNFLTHYAPGRISLHQLRSQRTHCLHMVRAAGQFIVDSVPFALGPLAAGKDKSPKVLFDALKMVWPLTAVYVGGAMLPKQKTEAEAALIFIGKEVGVRQALNTYPARLPLPPEARHPRGLDPEDDPTPTALYGQIAWGMDMAWPKGIGDG